MYFHIAGHHIYVSPVVQAAVIATGVGVVLTLLIICCCWCWCCCCRNNRKNKKGAQKIHVENHLEVTGKENGVQAEQWQHQNNPKKLAEQPMMANYSSTPVPTPYSESNTRVSTIPPKSARKLPRSLPQSPYVSHSTEDSLSSTMNESSVRSFGSSQTKFSYDELATATNGFSKGNILGQGGFGLVHKGILPTGKEIAVKSLKSDSGQGDREFQAEVEIISRVHHKHLVSLVGYCTSGSHRLLVYELVPNKTLEFHLHGKGKPPLDWPTRMKIALGAAKGLAYLHEDCHPRIIHRDIKAANILIDGNFEAKVADFGLAKFNSLTDTSVNTRVMGTIGYLAPEYASSGNLTVKSDVYSFGVMLLELITGRRPYQRTQAVTTILVEWARPLLTAAIEDEKFNDLVDPQIQHSYIQAEMSRLVYCAATCVRSSAKRRPQMSQVVRALEGNLSLGDLSVGVTPGRSMMSRYESTSEYSDSQYTGTSKGYANSELGGTTSEYNGLYTSGSSSESQTTRELDTEAIKRDSRHSRQRI